ncbi:MAG TPA: hypothetical protein VNK04_10775 [Gemmataceae bacterium]|nr:hypothetical protein [Gemmataceae bacterium]
MPLPFDATMKDLVQAYLPDYLAQLGLTHPGPVKTINVDLSTVTAQADIVVQVGEPVQWLIHLEFQTTYAANLPRRLLMYNALLHERYGVPVDTVVVLLRRQADGPTMTGSVRYQARPGRGGMDFGFEVVRLWQRPVEAILSGGLGSLPLAPLCQLPQQASPEEALSGVLHQIEERLAREAPPQDAAKLMTATFVLTGMRVSRDILLQLFGGIRMMRESSAYEVILDEGRLDEAKRFLLRLGQRKFGPPGEQVEAVLRSITDLERLERMGDRLLVAATWQELLDTP